MTTNRKAPTNNPEFFMRRAIRLARNGFPAPNPHVGCVLVKNGEIVGEGWHKFRGADHAEVMALKHAGASAKGATAYVTLEPCNHTSALTGPCSLALIQAGIAEVYFACADPDPVATGGSERLRAEGLQVSGGLLQEEARAVNEQFLEAIERKRSYVVLKAAMSQDGSMGLPDRQIWLTGELARRAAHRLRAECGSVLVGRGTVEVDDPLLTARIPGVKNQPTRVILDPDGRLGNHYQVFQSSSPQTIRVTKPGRGGDIEVPKSRHGFDLAKLMERLYEQRILGVLVEGGPATLARFLEADLADRVEIFLAPPILGGGLRWDGGCEILAGKNPQFVLKETRKLGIDNHLSFRRTTTN